MRENRLSGSEGGGAANPALPTPIRPTRPRLTQAGVNYLLVGALHRPAADPVTQPQVLVVVHAGGVVGVVADERVQFFPQFRGGGPEGLEPRDHRLHVSGA